MSMETTVFSIKPYTHKELAALYRCSKKTLRTWLQLIEKELGPKAGHTYSPRQVRIIVEKLGEP